MIQKEAKEARSSGLPRVRQEWSSRRGEVTPVTALDAPLLRRTGQRIRGFYRATVRPSPFANEGRAFEVLVGT